LGWALLCLLLLPAAVQAKPLQIMILGEDHTAPPEGGSGFRLELWRQLVEADLRFDFVGTRVDRPVFGWWPTFRGRTFDPDHEGHAGWRIDHITQGRDDEPEAGDLEGWLDTYTPDIAIVLLGKNDVLQGHETEWSARHMRRLIELLRRDNERIAILLASPPPIRPEPAGRLAALAQEFEAIAERQTTQQSPIRYVDVYHSFDDHSLLGDDGRRLTLAGHRLVASRLASALFLLDEAHLAPTRRTSAQLWGAVLVIPAGAAVVFYLLARSQLRREKEARHDLTHTTNTYPTSPTAAPAKATRISADTPGPIRFPG
jgi:hypothetical protein